MSVVIPAGYEAVIPHSHAMQADQQTSTSVIEPKAEEVKSMSLKTIIDDIPARFASFFKKAGKDVEIVVTDLDKAALIVEPFVDIAFPGTASMYNITVAAVGNANNAAIAAGATGDTTAQKIALVSTSIESSFNTYWSGLGHTASPTQTDIETYINAVTATLIAIPSPSATGAVKAQS